MKVLVTGGKGFIGRHAAAEVLERSHSLRVLKRPSAEVESPSARSGGVEGIWTLLRNRFSRSSSRNCPLQ